MNDVFFSYRRADGEQALPLIEALRRRGVTVWLDQHALAPAERITGAIAKGVATSRLLVAWYSKIYPESRPCQWELATAWLAATHEGGNSRRVLAVNPEEGAAHIQPAALADTQALAANLGPDAMAERIVALLASLPSTPLGDIRPLAPAPWHGSPRPGSNRFVGRGPELWRVHSALAASGSVIVTNAPPGRNLAQVRGLASRCWPRNTPCATRRPILAGCSG